MEKKVQQVCWTKGHVIGVCEHRLAEEDGCSWGTPTSETITAIAAAGNESDDVAAIKAFACGSAYQSAPPESTQPSDPDSPTTERRTGLHAVVNCFDFP
jgi:hypothetical protein